MQKKVVRSEKRSTKIPERVEFLRLTGWPAGFLISDGGKIYFAGRKRT
jgi:hypothetical protein